MLLNKVKQQTMKRAASSDHFAKKHREEKHVKLEPEDVADIPETGTEDAIRTGDLRMKMLIGRMQREKRLTKVHFYIADHDNDKRKEAEIRADVFGIALRDSSKANSTGMICSLFASAVSVVLVELKQDFRNALIAHDLDLIYVSLPSQADQYRVDVAYDGRLSWIDVLTLLVASLLIIFKNTSHEGYNKFINNRLRALRSCIGCMR